MENDTKKPQIFNELDRDFREVFDLFVESRLKLDKASFMLKKIRMLLSSRVAYEAIIDLPDGDSYIATERLLSELDEGTIIWRSYMIETEKEQTRKSTKNNLIDFDRGIKYH